VIKAFWRVRHELISQVLCGLRREKTGMRVSELIELAMHRREHVGMRVAEAGNCRTTAGIDIFDAIAFEDGQVDRTCAVKPFAKTGQKCPVTSGPA
jgi:hypothetical protein